ncbi:MAG TPA: hypothetical protein VEX18_20780, partial [Polyangiaceae bacterium]|nr:hypothetical protein [Polyangiaceae bacterium]
HRAGLAALELRQGGGAGVNLQGASGALDYDPVTEETSAPRRGLGDRRCGWGWLRGSGRAVSGWCKTPAVELGGKRRVVLSCSDDARYQSGHCGG